jgi:hypothetical protein
MMTKIKRYLIPVFVVLCFVAVDLNGFFNILDLSPSTTTVWAGDKDKDKDDDKDKDKDKDDDKDKDVDVPPEITTITNCTLLDFGICAYKAVTKISGMKAKMMAASSSGSILADVTSADVYLGSLSGDLSGNGLTGLGKFITDTGNIRVQYCVPLQDIAPGNTLNVIQANISADGSDATNIRFQRDSQYKHSISSTASKTVNKFTNCPSCNFELIGSVANYLFISPIKVTSPPCKF